MCFKNLSEEEKNNIEALVRDAIGFKQERGRLYNYI